MKVGRNEQARFDPATTTNRASQIKACKNGINLEQGCYGYKILDLDLRTGIYEYGGFGYGYEF